MEVLSAKIRMLRTVHDLNQKELADATGLTQATICRIESGKIKNIKLETLKRLAGSLDTTVDKLIGLSAKDVRRHEPNRDRLIFWAFEKWAEMMQNIFGITKHRIKQIIKKQLREVT